MKAVFVTEHGGPEILRMLEVEMPILQPKQVLIRVEATGVNFADIKSRYGGYHGAGNPPFIPGLDVAGTIEAVGSEVTQLQVGQRVIAFPLNGSYAEFVATEEVLTFPIPDSMDFDTAAACPIVAFTSYKLLAEVARIEVGETVLIHAAAGGIGTTAIQLAKILGASQVIGTVGSPAKVQAAIDAGADHVICYQEEDFSQKVNDLTDGKGVDIVLDSIAGQVTQQSLKCLAMYGRLVNFGNASGETGHVQTRDLHSSCRSVLGFSLGTTRRQRPHLLKQTAEKVLPLLADGRLKMNIGHHFKLEEAAAAHRLVESRQSIGKVLLHVRS